MDTELVVSVAQILTGAATLIVAVFLAGQLVLQRRVLARAHNDAEIELSISSNAFLERHFNTKGHIGIFT